MTAVAQLPPDLITVPEAGRRIGRSADSLYSLCRQDKFPPAIKIGGRWVVSVPRLERWLHGTEQKPVAS